MQYFMHFAQTVFNITDINPREHTRMHELHPVHSDESISGILFMVSTLYFLILEYQYSAPKIF